MELLTVQETAQLLRVAPITVRRYIADGALEAVKAGKGVRVRKESIEQFVKPLEAKGRKRQPSVLRGRPTSADDPLWNIVGVARSEGPTDVSANKHRYLAEAYAAETR